MQLPEGCLMLSQPARTQEVLQELHPTPACTLCHTLLAIRPCVAGTDLLSPVSFS